MIQGGEELPAFRPEAAQAAAVALRKALRGSEVQLFARQIVAAFRLGALLLASPAHLAHGLVSLNASVALCRKNMELSGQLRLLDEALCWRIPALLRGRTKARFAIGQEDGFALFQKRHQLLTGKMAADDEVFPESLVKLLNKLFESSWEEQEEEEE